MTNEIKIWNDLSISKPLFTLGTYLGKGFVYGCSQEGYIDSMFIKVDTDGSAYTMYGTSLGTRFYTEEEITEILQQFD